MYQRILSDPLNFPPDISSEARSVMTGLLQRDPQRRLGNHGGDEIKRHPFFARYIDWSRLMAKKIQPPFKPSVVSRRFLVNVYQYRCCISLFLGICVGRCQLRFGIHERDGSRLRRRGLSPLRDRSRQVQRLHLQPCQRALKRECQSIWSHGLRNHQDVDFGTFFPLCSLLTPT